MFNKDFFAEEPQAGPSEYGEKVGGIGSWGLHIAKVAFLVYSGYHGISASWNYAGNSDVERIAQMAGIIVLEVTLLSLYFAWHNQKITGAPQQIAAGITYALGFILACLGIVADSQLHAGMAMSPWMVGYLKWGLPVAPAVMALGALLTHELAPHQLRGLKQAAEKDNFADTHFIAHMAGQRAQLEAAKIIANMQLNAQTAAAKQVGQWYNGQDAQRAITATAMQNAPALLRAAGFNIQDVPDTNRNGQIDLAEIEAYLAQHPDIAARALARVRNEPLDFLDYASEIERAAADMLDHPAGRTAAPAGDELDQALELIDRYAERTGNAPAHIVEQYRNGRAVGNGNGRGEGFLPGNGRGS